MPITAVLPAPDAFMNPAPDGDQVFSMLPAVVRQTA